MKTKPLALLVAGIFSASQAYADNTGQSSDYVATVPTVTIESQADTHSLKGYLNYDEATATRNGLTTKEIPQTIDILNIQKNKNYGTNDLSSILEGNAGIDATYDMRGESLFIRGFEADANDIYRDGVRESGQVRRSTANIERVEIVKGPNSVLYGRGNGGGVINMVSKYANFQPNRTVGIAYGSWANRNINADINQVINDNVAIRLNAEYGKANSFRSGIDSQNRMISPSITVKSGNGLKWTAQYTYDKADRTPDRSPDKAVYDQAGIGYKKGFAHPNDFVTDTLQIWRSKLEYQINPKWKLDWQLAHRKAAQDFDHFYSGTYDADSGLLSRNYAWQQTDNKTLSNTFTLNGDFNIGRFENHLTVGYDFIKENRNPTLGFRRSFTSDIDPHADRSTWPHSGRLLDATIRNRHKTSAHGIFAQNVFSITPELKTVLGGRYDTYTFKSTDINHNSLDYQGHAFSPNAGIVWNITPAHTLYASYNRSFSPYGGNGYLNISTTDRSVFNSSPERNKQYEAGIKSSWLDDKLSTTLAVYRLERYNKRYRPDPQNDPLRWAVRGNERSQGIELSALGRIAPQWYLRGSLGVMSAKIREDHSKPQASGRHLNNTSNIQGNLFVRYMPNEKLYGEVGFTGTGKRYYYNRNDEYQPVPGFVRTDALVGYNHKNWNFTLAAYNLFNHQYWRSNDMPGSPRAFTARVNYSF